MNKRNLPILITGAIVLVVALVIFLITAALNGWSMIEWVKSQAGIWTFVLVGLYGLFVMIYLIYDKWRSL